MSDRKAVVSVPIDEWDDMRNKQQSLHDEIAALTRRLADAEQKDPTGRLEPMLQTIEAVIPIIQFAVSELHPDTVLRWPYPALRAFSDQLTALPGSTQHHKELAIDLRHFASHAEMRERERAARPKIPVEAPAVVEVVAEPVEVTVAETVETVEVTVAETAAETAGI